MAQKPWDFWLKNYGIARRNYGILHRGVSVTVATVFVVLWEGQGQGGIVGAILGGEGGGIVLGLAVGGEENGEGGLAGGDDDEAAGRALLHDVGHGLPPQTRRSSARGTARAA